MANMFAVKTNLSFLMVQLDALKIRQISPSKKQPQMKLSLPSLYIQSTIL